VIVVTALDAAGNERTVELPVTVDTTPPSIAMSAPGDGTVTSSDSVWVAGSTDVDQVSQVTVTVNGVAAALDAEGGFGTEVDLVEGTNLILVEAVDEAGNAVEVTRTVVRDSAAPFLDFDLPDAKLTDAGVHEVTSDRFKVTGFGELGTTVLVEGIAVDLDPETGFFSIELDIRSLEGQPPTVTVVAVDGAGNTSEETVSVKKVSEEEETSVSGAMGAAILVIGILLVLVAIYMLMRARAAPAEHGEEEVMDR
jgi:hypothetical protein